MNITHDLGNEQLLEILTHTKTATAVHIGELATIRFANQAMLDIWGKDSSVIGKTLEQALPELKGQPFIDMFAKVFREGLTIRGTDTPADLTVGGKTNTYYFDFEYRAMTDKEGKTICILHTATDVTERFLKQQAERQNAETEKFLALEQALNEELASTNEELSAAIEELSTANEQLSLTKETLRQLNEKLEQRVQERIATISELNQQLESTAEELKTSNEQLAASNEELTATVEELAQSREHLQQSLDQLANSEYRTRSIIESAPFPIGVYTGREMRIAFANRSITEVWGKGTEVIGKLYAAILPELSNQAIFEQLDDVFTTGTPFEARNQRIDLVVEGQPRTYFFNYNFTPLKTRQGEIYGVMNTAADVTDLAIASQQIEHAGKQYASLNEEMAAVNEELNASNEELVQTYEKLKISRDETELAISAAGLATFDFDPITGYFSGNEQLKNWFGLEPTEQIALQNATDVIAEDEREKVIAAITHALDPSSGGDYNTHYTISGLKGSKQRIVQAKGKTIFDEQGNPIRLSGVLLDVTEQVQSSMEIQEANTRLNIAIEAGSLGSTEVDLATGKMECNEQFKKCFGRTKDQEFNYPDLFAAMLPQYRDKVRDLVTKARENRTIYQAEYEVSWPDGSIHWISAHGKARYDSSGKSIKMVGIISDITEAKADEQRKNDFIAMVSHELKTPLTSLNGYVQLLHRNAHKVGDDFASQALQKASNQLKKMTSMINSFLNVSRLESGKIHIESQEFDLNGLLTEIQSELSFSPHNHQLVFELDAEPMVNADRDKIGHVLSNLISNAIKYSPGGSQVTISCTRNHGEIQVAVSDQGNGIREQDKPFLFERYYRVSDQPTSISGFGIGLYLCAEIIHRHNGKIWVESEFGKGSTFYFSLPVIQ